MYGVAAGGHVVMEPPNGGDGGMMGRTGVAMRIALVERVGLETD